MTILRVKARDIFAPIFLSAKFFIFCEKIAFFVLQQFDFEISSQNSWVSWQASELLFGKFLNIERNLKKNKSAGAYSKDKLDFWHQI